MALFRRFAETSWSHVVDNFKYITNFFQFLMIYICDTNTKIWSVEIKFWLELQMTIVEYEWKSYETMAVWGIAEQSQICPCGVYNK